MKRVKFLKDAGTPFNTRDMFVQLLQSNGPNGGRIADMIKKVDLCERIAAVDIEGEDPGFVFKDNEYDMIKALYESNPFPVNNRFFINVWHEIENYTSVSQGDAPKDKANANKT